MIYANETGDATPGYTPPTDGRTSVFNTPYDKSDPRNGQEVTVLDTFAVPGVNGPLDMHRVRFPDGIELTVWAEEVGLA